MSRPRTYGDLLALLPPGTDMTDYCGSHYYVWEKSVEPWIKAQGFTIVGWSHGKRDSFGPLSRILTVRDASGTVSQYVYG